MAARRPPGGQRSRGEMVEAHIGLARSLARRFANRGEALDDLNQVALLARVKAVDRFDAGRGVHFSTYATATITGELKRHFRDKRWGVHVGRLAQERYLVVRDTTDELITTLGRSPTVEEIAERTGLMVDDVLAAQETAAAFHLASLDAPVDDDGDHGIQVGGLDPELLAAEARMAVVPVLSRLSPRERAIVQLRFVERLSQSQIASELGISQMHVSRLLNRSLAAMRSWLGDI